MNKMLPTGKNKNAPNTKGISGGDGAKKKSKNLEVDFCQTNQCIKEVQSSSSSIQYWILSPSGDDVPSSPSSTSG